MVAPDLRPKKRFDHKIDKFREVLFYPWNPFPFSRDELGFCSVKAQSRRCLNSKPAMRGHGNDLKDVFIYLIASADCGRKRFMMIRLKSSAVSCIRIVKEAPTKTIQNWEISTDHRTLQPVFFLRCPPVFAKQNIYASNRNFTWFHPMLWCFQV